MKAYIPSSVAGVRLTKPALLGRRLHARPRRAAPAPVSCLRLGCAQIPERAVAPDRRQRRREVLGRGRRGRRPLQRPGVPRVLPRQPAPPQAVDDVDDQQQHAHRRDQRPERDQHVDRAPPGQVRVGVDPARHPHQPDDVHREERQVDADHRQPELPQPEPVDPASGRTSWGTSSRARPARRRWCRRTARSGSAPPRSRCPWPASRSAPSRSGPRSRRRSGTCTSSASAYSIGISKRIRPPQIVASQFRILTPVGIAITIVVAPKNASGMNPMPAVNMWCAQTSIE